MANERTLRHPNGGALKIGTEVHVSADSFCDSDSRIYGNTAVISTTMTGSMAENAHLFKSTLRASHAVGSTVAESALSLICAVDCVLHKVLGSGWPGGQMRLDSVVAENCELYGNWSLEGNARIPTGIWHRAPRFYRITGENGVDIGLTESTDGHALMACWRKPITKWLAFGPRLGRKHGWTEDQIRTAKHFFQQLLDVPQPS